MLPLMSYNQELLFAIAGTVTALGGAISFLIYALRSGGNK